MKSKANIKSHPLHPILIPFPIAFFTGTAVCHLIGWLGNKPDLLRTSYYLNIGGIAFALLAAVPGFIDFLYTVPPKSSGKKRAAKHGITNVVMLICFTIAFFLRRSESSSNIILALLEGIGVSLMVIAGWLGGTLVYRNQIGVDIRYANAGKWNEDRFDSDAGEIEVATVDELKMNSMKLLHVKDKRIVLARTEDRFVAFEDRCTHRGGSLAAGSTICNVVQCPWHGSQFDLITGEVKSGPAKEGIKIYSVREDNGKIILAL
jgi:uncharacterized membrane protein/nitrite reductase/ring-hydroxylating ferredoxin subunit